MAGGKKRSLAGILIWYIALVLVLLSLCGVTCYAAPEDTSQPNVAGVSPGVSALASPDLFTGTLTHTIPIKVPPGRKGLQPNLALTYRSSNGNSWIGKGWDLEVGAIQRSLKDGFNPAGDNYQFRSSGALSDLVNIPNSDEYRLKIEGEFTRIRKVATSDGFYWEATTKLGVRYLYGLTSASRLDGSGGIFKWCLSQVIDLDGNYVTFSYYKDAGNGQIYLDQIEYTGNINNSLPTTNYVKFYRESRTDGYNVYPANVNMNTAYRLKTIEVVANGNRICAYSLTYTYSPDTSQSLLTSVQEYGKDVSVDSSTGVISGGSTLPAINLGYTASNTAFRDAVEGWGQYDQKISGMDYGDPNRYRFADFTGDGRIDVMHDDSYNFWGFFRIMPSLGSTFSSPGYSYVTSSTTSTDPYHLFAYVFGLFTSSNFGGLASASIIAASALDSPSRLEFGISFGTNQGAAKNSAKMTSTSPLFAQDLRRYKFADVNGDGILDMIYIDPSGNLYVALGKKLQNNDDQPFEAPALWGQFGNGDPARYIVADFNGDGKADVLYINPDGSLWLSCSSGTSFYLASWDSTVKIGDGNPSHYLFADFNGDGKTDILYLVPNSNGSLQVALSAGNYFVPLSDWAFGFGNADPSRYKLADLNGDGMMDIIYIDSGGNQYFGLSTGKSFVTDNTHYTQFGNGDPTRYRYADFNGDGRAEALFINTDGTLSVQEQSSGLPPNLLSVVSNGYGGGTEIDYTPSTHYTTNVQLPFPVQTVSEVRVCDNYNFTTRTCTGNVSRTSYSYGGGFYHVGERDFRGFNYAKVTGPAGPNGEQSISETWFHQGNDTDVIPENATIDDLKALADVQTGYMKGKPYRTRITDGNLNTYSETETVYAANRSGDVFYFNPPAQVDTYICDGNVTGVCKGTPNAKHYWTEHQYDAEPGASEYGNLTYEKRHGDDADPRDDLTIYRTYSPNTTAWIVGLPASETIYEGIGTAGAKVASTTYYYDGGVTNCAMTSTNQIPDKGKVTRTVRWLHYGTDPDLEIEERMAYDPYGNIYCRRDANANTTTIGYDPSNTFPVTVTSPPTPNSPAGLTTITSYYGVGIVPAVDGLYGQKASETDPNNTVNAVTTYKYDTLGRKKQVVAPDQFTTTWYYLDFGVPGQQRIRTETSDGLWSESYFDGLMRPIKDFRKGPDAGNPNSESDTVYDARGNMQSRTMPAYPQDYATAVSYPTTYTYDPLGRVALVTSYREDAKTATVRTCYDRNATVTIDPNGHLRRQVRDANGRLVMVQEYTGSSNSCSMAGGTLYATTTYVYDVLGNLLTVTDAKNQAVMTYQTVMKYDSLGRKRYMSDPDMGVWSYDYDANGNLKTQTDAKGQIITFTYDALNRLTTKHYPSGPDIVMTYDEVTPNYFNKGRLTKMTDTSGHTVYNYDNMGRISNSTKTITDNNVNTDYKLGFDYLNGRLNSITYPVDNEVVTYGYDAAGNLNNVGGLMAGNPFSYVTYLNYDALGRPGNATYGNLVSTHYSYHPLSKRLTDLLVARTDPITKNIQRLIDNTYGYDSKGNITSITDNLDKPLPTNFTGETYIPVRAHAVASTGISGRQFQYDANGNMCNDNGSMCNDGQHSITYNYDNMPTAIPTLNGNAGFVYDGNGTRVKKTFGSDTTHYVDKLFECTNGLCSKYIFAGDKRVAVKSGTVVLYYHPDHQDSTAVVTNAGSGVEESISYYPFGGKRMDSGDGAIINLKHKYTSQELDRETGLYNYNARIYDPDLGRFLTPDSIVQNPGDPQALNRYAYVRNNPVLYNDPTGHFLEAFIPILVDVFIGAAEGAAVGTVISAATGGNIGQGAFTGAITGGFFGGVGFAIGPTGFDVTDPLTQAGMHTMAGASSGAINSALTGGDVGMGAAIGGVSAGVAKYAGGFLPDNYAAQLAGRSVIGGLIGGSVAEAYGGDFGKGFANGAMTSGIGDLANGLSHELGLGNALRTMLAPKDTNDVTKCHTGPNENELKRLGVLTVGVAGVAATIEFWPYLMTAAGTQPGQKILGGIGDFFNGYGNPPGQPTSFINGLATTTSVYNDWLAFRGK